MNIISLVYNFAIMIQLSSYWLSSWAGVCGECVHIQLLVKMYLADESALMWTQPMWHHESIWCQLFLHSSIAQYLTHIILPEYLKSSLHQSKWPCEIEKFMCYQSLDDFLFQCDMYWVIHFKFNTKFIDSWCKWIFPLSLLLCLLNSLFLFISKPVIKI